MEDIQILDATVQNLVTSATWCRGMVRPYCTEFTVTKQNVYNSLEFYVLRAGELHC